MAGPVSTIDASTQSKTCLKNSASKSPILIFLFFHKAIKSELDCLHRAAMAFATNSEGGGDISSLLERYHFFRAIYKHHCNAEDEVSRFGVQVTSFGLDLLLLIFSQFYLSLQIFFVLISFDCSLLFLMWIFLFWIIWLFVTQF